MIARLGSRGSRVVFRWFVLVMILFTATAAIAPIVRVVNDIPNEDISLYIVPLNVFWCCYWVVMFRKNVA